MKKAFTLVEVLIVVAILGILAAIALPTFQAHSQEAKESAAKDNLRILRNAIELYAAQHDGVPPGYPNNDPTESPNYIAYLYQIYKNGQYFTKLPENPFNEQSRVTIVGDNEIFPTQPEDTLSRGWIYQPATKTIKLNWEGTDSAGAAYFDY